MEKQNSMIFWTKTVIVLVLLGVAYIGFETIKRSSFEYQKRSILSAIREFSNKYVKDEKDKKKINKYIQNLEVIFSKYKN